MSNWDLMMPGMGLTSIGLAGVTLSYAGIAHTFVDGMHALTGLTMFIGLIFLAAGILEGGVSTSKKAKITVLVIVSISLSLGTFALTINTISTLPIFVGVLIGISFPSIIFAYVITKMPSYAKPAGLILGMATAIGMFAFFGFGIVSPDTVLVDEDHGLEELDIDVSENVLPVDAPIYEISILAGSSTPDTPDYDPDSSQVDLGSIIEWTNNDIVVHTSTSDEDFGETFDSGLLKPNEKFRIDTSQLGVGSFDYICIVHPWMKANFTIIEP